jgi:signal transduction histidine kinase
MAFGVVALAAWMNVAPEHAVVRAGSSGDRQVVSFVEPGSHPWLEGVRAHDPVEDVFRNTLVVGTADSGSRSINVVPPPPGWQPPLVAVILVLAALLVRRVGLVGSALLLVLSGGVGTWFLHGYATGLLGISLAAAPPLIALVVVRAPSSRLTRVARLVSLAAVILAVVGLAMAWSDLVPWSVAWFAPSVAALAAIIAASGAHAGVALRRWRALPSASRSMSDVMVELIPAARRARLRALEEERDRLSLDVHDEVLPRLHRSLRRLDAVDTEASAELREVEEDLRRLMNRRQTVILRYGGLGPALEAAVAEATSATLRARLIVDVPDDGRRPRPDVELAAYRIATEALNNVSKHAAATQVVIRVWRPDDRSLDLRISDDGRGFDPATRRRDGHVGLDEMRQRARDVGGSLDIGQPAVGTGTEVHFRWPG